MSLQPCFWLRVSCFGICQRAYDVAAVDVQTLKRLTQCCPVCHSGAIERPVEPFRGKTVSALPFISRGMPVGVPLELVDSVMAARKRRSKGKRGRSTGDTKVNQQERKEASCRAKAARAGSQSDSLE